MPSILERLEGMADQDPALWSLSTLQKELKSFLPAARQGLTALNAALGAIAEGEQPELYKALDAAVAEMEKS